VGHVAHGQGHATIWAYHIYAFVNIKVLGEKGTLVICIHEI